MDILSIVKEARRWLVLVLAVAAIVLVAIAAYSWRRAGRAEDALLALQTREKLRDKGDIPVEPVEDLKPQLAAAMAENTAFRDQVQKLQRDLKGAKAELLVRASVQGEAGGTPAPVESKPCLLFESNVLRLQLTLAGVRGEANVAAVAGTMEALRVDKKDEVEVPVLLLSLAFNQKTTLALERAEAPPLKLPRFSVGTRAWWRTSDPLLGVPSAVEISGGLRVIRGWWLDVAARTDGERAAGLHLEF